MPRLKITHNNGHQEIVTAQRYRADGCWIIFENADKQEVHRSKSVTCKASLART